ncbi:BCCT family transporter [Candidatus Formimonas warabiya]|uniref:Transporter n=1 Tax=Formimonas warabiya TaxID=1761012 RepID=A0A3G1KXU3_FORW1|nr:BCCT family transporter [Candidatus Formimonas warabiya]ATW27262.1 transporter [Candidatus Formimonas warabiya]
METPKQTGFKHRDISEYTKDWGLFGKVDPTVFIVSAVFLIAFTLWGIVDNKGLGTVFGAALSWTIKYTGWLYMGGVFFILLWCLYMAFSKYGQIKLGKPEDVPEYSNFSWFSMLFGCGMGVGLVFWAVGEPLYHYMSGPTYAGDPASTSAAEWSMAITFLHWGLSAWAVYVVIGIAMGILMYKKGLPALVSTCFYPLLGDRIYGPIGKIIDIVTLVAVFFGQCTTIGLGVMQLSSGVNFNYGVPLGLGLNIVILFIVTAVYLASACLPIEKGIKTGSNISMICTVGILLYMFLAGPTTYILNNFVNGTGLYLQNIIKMSLWTDPVGQTGWAGGWTIYYWAWWISWAPFVGLFIAKISKGRTIKEFVLAALIAPSFFDMIFMDIIGSTALNMELVEATKGVVWGAVQNDLSSAIYVMFDMFPGAVILAPILLFVSFTFFVVSADSATIVLGTLSSGGNNEPRTSLKLLWGITMAVAAGVLLVAGGLSALQGASIVGALAFTIVMLFLCYLTPRILREDYMHEVEARPIRVSGSKESASV